MFYTSGDGAIYASQILTEAMSKGNGHVRGRIFRVLAETRKEIRANKQLDTTERIRTLDNIERVIDNSASRINAEFRLRR